MHQGDLSLEGSLPVTDIRRFPLRRLGLGLVGLAALWILGRWVGGYVPAFADWVGGLGFWGPLVFIGGYALAVVGFVPGALLTLSGGAIFGLVEGTLYVFIAAVLGSIGAFLIARYAARTRIERHMAGNDRFQAIDRAVGRQGLKIIFLLRLSPAFPFSFMNYALGLTGVSLRDYALASFGMLPGTLLYVYYGKVLGSVAALAGGVAPARGMAENVLLGAGLLATIVVTAFVTRIARRALEDVTHD